MQDPLETIRIFLVQLVLSVIYLDMNEEDYFEIFDIKIL